MAKSVADLDTEIAEVASRGKEVADSIEGDGPTDEQREKLREHAAKLDELKGLRAKAEEDEGLLNGIRAAADDADKRTKERAKAVVPPIYGGNGKQDDSLRTPGEAFTDSDAYRQWVAQFPQGAPTGKAHVFSNSVKLENARSWLGMQTGTEAMRTRQLVQRALVTSGDASAGDLVRPYWGGLLEPGMIRPLRLRQLLTVIPVTTDAVEYAKEDTRTEAAAPVAEATALTGTSGLKPEAGLTFELVTQAVRTIAVWVPATKRIIADATGLRAYIDQFLMEDVAKELEDQIISGSGSGENFRGILNTTGVDDAGTGEVLEVIREAKRRVQIGGRTDPTAIVLHPEDSEKIDVLKINAEVNHFVGPGPYVANQPPSIWGMVRVESEAITAGTFLVGDFRRAILFDREDTSISVGTAGDDFIRNIVRALAEMRAAFGVVRPAAFCKGTVA